MRNMASSNTEQNLKCFFGLTVAILIFHMCDAESIKGFSLSNETLPYVLNFTDSNTEYLAEIEINASSIFMIEYIKNYLKSVPNKFTIGNVTIFDISFTTVCDLVDTGYQCTCEDQYWWPCDMCKKHGNCSATNDTCSCINTYVDGQHCRPVGEIEDRTACMSVPSDTTATKTTTAVSTSPTSAAPYGNECQVIPSVCGPNSNCTNVNGGHNCSCWDGFSATFPNLTISINNTCTDINECLNSSLVCGPNAYCRNSNGSFSCSCLSGYNVTKMNESVSNSNPCTDVNECQVIPSVCGPNSNCTNVNGGHNCSCWDGFNSTFPNLTISINNTCTDIYECLNSSLVCGPNAYCHNSNGSFSCSCLSGYNVTKMNESVSNSNPCTDVNECQMIPSVCGPNSNCTNVNGGHNCSCWDGFTATIPNLPISINNTCTDINECLSSSLVCGPNAHCYNSNGSFSCSCLSGYKVTKMNESVSNSNTCTDVNECQVIPSVCGLNSNCTNVNGGHNCSCWDGFTATIPNLPISINNTCTDINECLSSSLVCGPNAHCYNSNGSFSCSCLSGYKVTKMNESVSNSNTCTDVNECQVIPSVCGPNSNCTNVNGGHNCSCWAGFTATFQNLPISINNTCTAETTTTKTSTTAATSPATPSTSSGPSPPVFNKVISLSLIMEDLFDTSLTKPDGENYIKKTGTIQSALDQGYAKLSNYKRGSAKIFRFRSGSVIADYSINATNNNLDLSSANTQVTNTLNEAGIKVAQNAFEESVENNLTTKANYYPRQSMELRCTRPETFQGTMKWKVNGKDPAENIAKYNIINDNSTLTVKDVSETDSGRYSCIIERSTIPYVQWQNVVIQLRPNIIVDNNEIKYECSDQTVSLRCCAEGYPIEWYPIPSNDTVDSETGCIKLQHKILSTSCGTPENFTCRLKNMKELETFDYYKTDTKVQTVRDFNCTNATLGVGKIDDIVTGPCEKGLEGIITYECQQINLKNDWISIKRECVVKAIKDLEKKAEVLVVEQIPAFVANLSNTAVNLTTEISQSAATVQTIVEMLVKVANISQNVTIDENVMKDFLRTVNIIVSDNTLSAWQNITKNGTTAKSSTDLLRAIEYISDRLSGDNFTIKESSIQLTRATIKSKFTETSKLPNSTTQVVIPIVVKPTLVTVIFLTKIDQILPTRDTNNDNSVSEKRINGDVVVIKVNETINNISFTFDITNTSLGNPQCVFWSFSLDRWDTTGCKFKTTGNEMNNVTCECDHTTSFSILMSPYGIKNPILDYITYIGVAISIACLILCLIIETIIWKSVTRNNTSHMRHVSIVNIAVSLLIADIWFIIGAAILNPGEPTPVNPCSAAVFFMHFFYLALFFWMFISALLLLYRTVMVFSQMSRAKMMVIGFTVGYGAPLLIAVITVASTAGAGRYIWTRDACWLNWNESKALLAFVIPALTIVAFNIMVVVVVVYKMLRRGAGSTPQPDEKHVLVVIVRCLAILTPIFGLTWGFGIGTMVSPNIGVHVVFTILNSFQGFFVLVFGTLLDSKVRDALAGKLSLKNFSSNPTRSTNGGIPSSSGLGFFERLRKRNVYNTSNPSAARSANSTGASESLNP